VYLKLVGGGFPDPASRVRIAVSIRLSSEPLVAAGAGRGGGFFGATVWASAPTNAHNAIANRARLIGVLLAGSHYISAPARYNSLYAGNICSSGLSAGATALSALSYSRVAGANDRILVGVIGCGARGLYDMQNFQQHPEVHVAAVSDVYGQQMERPSGRRPGAKGLVDYRKLLEIKELNAVIVATPDHWHAPCAIDALNAGLDVFVEKPLSLRIERRAGDREGGASERARVPGRHAATLGPALSARQEGVSGYRAAGEDHPGAHLVARQRLSPAARSGLLAEPAGGPGLGHASSAR